jgi:hypothetical protein
LTAEEESLAVSHGHRNAFSILMDGVPGGKDAPRLEIDLSEETPPQVAVYSIGSFIIISYCWLAACLLTVASLQDCNESCVSIVVLGKTCFGSGTLKTGIEKLPLSLPATTSIHHVK